MMLHKARISLGSITSRRCFASQENAASSKIKKLLEKEAPPAFGDRMIGLDPIGDRRPELFHPEGNIYTPGGAIEHIKSEPWEKGPFEEDYNVQDLTTLESFSYQTQTASFKTALNLGLHWGHSYKKVHPSMRPYIKGMVHGRHVIDLSLTIPAIRKIVRLLQSLVQDKCEILFVGNGDNADINRLNQMMALKVQQPYLEHQFVKNSFKSWDAFAFSFRCSGKPFPVVAENELTGGWKHARKHQQAALFRRCRGVPDFIFLTTKKYNQNIIAEANFQRIPIAALCDTDDDVRDLQYVIPCNTESPQAVHFVLDMITRGVLEAQEKMETDWWREKDATKSYVQALKEAQDTYTTDLFLEERTKHLSQKDISYDSDNFPDDDYPDDFDTPVSFEGREEARKNAALEIRATRMRSRKDKKEAVNNLSADPKNREMAYLERVRKFNHEKINQEGLDTNQAQIDTAKRIDDGKIKRAKGGEHYSQFSFTDLVSHAHDALSSNKKAFEKYNRRKNQYTKDIY